MKKKFHDLLHAYKVDAYRIAHNEHDPATKEAIAKFTEQALDHAFTYHFHKDPSPERLETFTMIKNYTTEALMPPLIEMMMRRVIALEKQNQRMVKLVDDLLETLSEDGQAS